MGFFNIFLPTLDVYGDASLIVSWFIRGHTVYAGLMTVPMAFNYVFTTYKWWSMEKEKKSDSRKWSWVLLLFQVWQQWNALKVMIKLFKKDDRAEEEKNRILKELSSIEPFFESLPSILIMTCIGLHTLSYGPFGSLVRQYNSNSFECFDTASLRNYEQNFCVVFNGFGGPAWFFTTYAVSILAGSFGICKFLQNGPVAILPSNMMNWPLARAYFTVMFSLIAKVLFVSLLIGLARKGSDYDKRTNIWLFPLILITINIVPNTILSVIGVSLKTGWNKTLVTSLLDYPAFMVLPAFTNFAVGPPQLTYSKSIESSEQNLTVSGKLTAINTVLTGICYGITIGILNQLVNSRPVFNTLIRVTDGLDGFALYFGIMFSPVLIMSMFSIMIFYIFDRRMH